MEIDEVLQQQQKVYEDAAAEWAEHSGRIRAERVEQLVQIKKQAGDNTALTKEELDGILPEDIMKYIELHPEDIDYFDSFAVFGGNLTEILDQLKEMKAGNDELNQELKDHFKYSREDEEAENKLLQEEDEEEEDGEEGEIEGEGEEDPEAEAQELAEEGEIEEGDDFITTELDLEEEKTETEEGRKEEEDDLEKDENVEPEGEDIPLVGTSRELSDILKELPKELQDLIANSEKASLLALQSQNKADELIEPKREEGLPERTKS